MLVTVAFPEVLIEPVKFSWPVDTHVDGEGDGEGELPVAKTFKATKEARNNPVKTGRKILRYLPLDIIEKVRLFYRIQLYLSILVNP